VAWRGGVMVWCCVWWRGVWRGGVWWRGGECEWSESVVSASGVRVW
jgi:hypothetical protein